MYKCMADGHRHAPARLVHSLRLLAKAFLVDVGSGLALHDLGGVGDLGAAHELGFLCREWKAGKMARL